MKYDELKDIKNQWEAIVSYMDDYIREDIHNELAPCNAGYFLKEYCKRDVQFEAFLGQEFGLSLDETTITYFNQI